MVHAKDVLANQLLAGANDPSWHLPYMQAVENVTEEEAFWKPGEGVSSIAELTQHLLYWNEAWQSRYREGIWTLCLRLRIITSASGFRQILRSVSCAEGCCRRS